MKSLQFNPQAGPKVLIQGNEGDDDQSVASSAKSLELVNVRLGRSAERVNEDLGRTATSRASSFDEAFLARR